MTELALEDVDLTFHLRTRGALSLKDWVLGRVLRRPLPPGQTVEALRGVSFRLGEGERLGIVGHNGAGKSTLLRVLAGVYRPSAGRRFIRGRVSSLFELGLGFEMDATGWENIRYRGYLQKETPRTIGAKAEAIAAFSELGPALDMPIRYYSSGMLVRLAFSIATSIEPEILLIDEILSAGDMAFQEKARRRMQELIGKARAIVLVSHDTTTLARTCDRVLWLDHGCVRKLGPALETITAYAEYMSSPAARAA